MAARQTGSSSNDNSIFALAINADASNRKGELKGDNLVPGLEKLFDIASKQMGESSSIITISEMGATTKMKALIPLLNKEQKDDHRKMDWHYASHRLNGKDGIVTAYDQSVFEAEKDVVNSDQGRYQALRLTMKSNNLKLLYFSVHLPHRKNKKEAHDLLVKAISELSEGFDAVIIGGDWNMKPEEIIKKFSTQDFVLKLALTKDDGGTSLTGRTIDNFVIFQRARISGWEVSFSGKKIMSEQQYNKENGMGYTTHASIWAKVDFKKIDDSATGATAAISSPKSTPKCSVEEKNEDEEKEKDEDKNESQKQVKAGPVKAESRKSVEQ